MKTKNFTIHNIVVNPYRVEGVTCFDIEASYYNHNFKFTHTIQVFNSKLNKDDFDFAEFVDSTLTRTYNIITGIKE